MEHQELAAGFLFAIIVGEFDGELTIVAVAHPSREPGYWRDRLK